MSDPVQPAGPVADRAIFLSYAREDTDAARRIADALRAFGLEVWLDQSELRGGDAWDQKIKRQIRECALFVAIISGQTQARGEGYFRREWKLGVERTHDMHGGVAFILPVVVDDTPEASALVPDEFMRVHWTRLPKGVPTPQFVEQVRRLLEGKASPAFARRPIAAGVTDPGPAPASPAPTPPASRWVWAGVLLVTVLGVAMVYLSGRKSSPRAAGLTPPASAAASPSLTPSSQPPVDSKSIAVLPFANFSPDKENEFFADGLHDEVITALTKIHDLKVISRTSVMAYRNPEGRNLKKIAADLGVATVLEGSVQRAGNQVHLNVQLIDARTDSHLWADSYTKDLTDIFSVEAELAAAVTSELNAALSPEEKSLLARRPTANPEAYDLYLRARSLAQNLVTGATRADYERVIGFYEQAAAKDPTFLLPHVQASILHDTLYWFGALDATPERRAKAQAELEIAQRLAPDAPETLLAQGSFDYACRNDWARAVTEYRAAEAGLPNDAQLQFRIGLAHRRLGQWPEALDCLARAAVLNPNDNFGITNFVGTVMALHRYPQVIELTGRYLGLFPDDRALQSARFLARFELDGDRTAFLRAWAGMPPAPTDAHGLQAAYQLAMLTGDLAAADRTLADPGMTSVLSADGTIPDPVALHRALVAWLRGRPDEARRWANAAIAAYRGQSWPTRQAAWARMGVARAEAYAGRVDDAILDGKAALGAELTRDAYSAPALRNEYGKILVIGNRREDALALLRDIVAGPSVALDLAPNVIRFDPLWSRLKDDPRFEEILQSAKPL